MNHTDFKDKARRHQIDFKIHNDEIKVAADKYPVRIIHRKDTGKDYRIEVRSSLRWEDCRDSHKGYRIFFSGFRKEISEEVNKTTSTSKGQMVTNLLRSEHIPYNLFFPMRHDLKGTMHLFNRILGTQRIAEITKIMIEYNPGGLRDGTSFDTYIEYIPIGAKTGEKGGIGIEVKYTEKEYLIKRGSKEWNETHDESGAAHLANNYKIPSQECGWFKAFAIEDVASEDLHRLSTHVTTDNYRQIWRNHILGASMVLGLCSEEKDKLKEFTSLTVYPKDNGHFCETFPKYESMLTPLGLSTFKHITYEELFPLIEACLNTSCIPNLTAWVDYLKTRYLISL